MSTARRAAFVLLLVLLAAAAVGIVTGYRRPPADPLLDQARLRIADGDQAGAADIARGVLARDPSHGRAFGVLAPALADPQDPEATLAHYEVAARRAPRDVHVRGWLAAHHLQAGRFDQAMPHLDALLTVSPASREQALPAIVQLAADQAFAEALAAHLAAQPRWRSAILRAALRSDDPAASDNLHAALRALDALPTDAAERWIEGMLADGRWGTAYAYWLGGLGEVPDKLPLLHNGDFSQPLAARGFGWRLRRTNGVVAGRVDAPGGARALRMTFLGRSVGRTGLEQPLLLAPGRHRLEMRVRTRDLRSHRGLEWQLTCSDNRTRIAAGATITRHPQWAPLSLEFEVPAENCEGQWLRLVNPAPRGAARALRGELQLADLAIQPVP